MWHTNIEEIMDYTIVAIVSGIIIPLLGFLVVIAVQWGGIRADLRALNKQLADIVQSEEETHKLITDQLRIDRDATDKRLRWLEEHLWNKR